MKFRAVSISLTVMLLATLLVPVAVSSPLQAQSQTSWSVNDNPTLFGPQQFWFHGASGHGYGTNNYRYTYAIGGDPSANNWARWNMGSRVGQQEIQVYVPSNHATATVNYNVTIGGSTSRVRVAQNGTRGWYSLGNWNTNGANVVIAVYDNDAEQHHERNGLASSSIGVDAIAMRCVSNCGSSSPPPPPPPPSERNVTISLGANNSGSQYCPFSQLPCRWINITLSNFARGSQFTRCVWLNSEAGDERVPISGNITHDGGSSGLLNRYCSFNVREGRSVWVTIDGVRSNILRFSGTTSGEVSTSESESPPSEPRNVSAVAHSTRQLRVTWSPPSNSGSAAISHYTVRYSRPAIGTSGPWQSRLYRVVSRSHLSPNLRFGTTYKVTVTAVNGDSRASNPATDTATTRIRSAPSPTSPSQPQNVSAVAHGTRQLRVTWSPPSNSGSAPISHYTVRYSRPAIGTSGPWQSRLYRAVSGLHLSPGLRFGTTYKVTVTAVNRDNRASSPATDTDTTRITSTAGPPQPRNVRAVAHGARQIRVTWSPPSESGSAPIRHYTVQYSRPAIGDSPPWQSRLYTTTSNSHTGSGLRYGTTYTVAVAAVNRDNRASTPATDTATTRIKTTTLGKVGDVKYEIGPHKTRNEVLYSVDTISWDAVPGATSYEFEWEYPNAQPPAKYIRHADARCRNNRCSAEFLRNPRERPFTIRVRAKIGSRTGPWSPREDDVEHIPCDASVRDVRYRTEIEGIWLFGTQIRIYATKDFWTSSGDLIEEDEQGGKILGNNIDTSGCSWIYRYATVRDSAFISGDSVISGSAVVSGSAKVYDEASVSGNAQVSGNAEVYGHAEVSGNAQVNGYARVYDYAVLTGDMEASCNLGFKDKDECKFNGDLEHKRAAEEIYTRTYQLIYADFIRCMPSTYTSVQKAGFAREILANRPFAIGEALKYHCIVKEGLEKLREAEPSGWSVALDLLLAFAGSIRSLHLLSRYARSLVEIADAAKTLYDLNVATAVFERVNGLIDQFAKVECEKVSTCG